MIDASPRREHPRRLTTTRLMVMAILLSAAGLPAPADAAAPVASGGGAGSGWVATRLLLDGREYTFEISTRGSSGTESVGFAIYDSSATVVRTLTLTVGDDDHGVLVDADGQRLAQTPTGIEVLTGPGGATITGTMNGEGMVPEQGVYYLVLWGAHKSGTWSFVMDGALTILGRNDGNDAIALTSSDFSGTAVAQARPLHRWGGPAAFVGAQAKFEIDHTFIGSADTPLLSALDLVVTRPDSRTATCPCWPRDLTGPKAWGPGSYTVSHDGVDVVLTGGTDTHIMGVDVELPLG